MIRRTPLKKVSDKRRQEMQVYTERRMAFLDEFFLCQVEMKEKGYDHTIAPIWCGNQIEVVVRGDQHGGYDSYRTRISPKTISPSTDVHHAKRRGKNYLDVSTWFAVSRAAHIRIETNPSWARANGWLA